jgi:hypothetical protein
MRAKKIPNSMGSSRKHKPNKYMTVNPRKNAVATGGNFVVVNHLLSNDGQRPRPMNVYAPIKDDIAIYPRTVRQIY